MRFWGKTEIISQSIFQCTETCSYKVALNVKNNFFFDASPLFTVAILILLIVQYHTQTLNSFSGLFQGPVIFEIDEDGKLVRWIDHFDVEDSSKLMAAGARANEE